MAGDRASHTRVVAIRLTGSARLQTVEPVFSRIRDRNIWVVNIAIFLLMTAYGLAIALVSPFLEKYGFTASDIGNLATFFAAGVVLFSLPVGTLIRKFSARSVLLVSLLGYAVVIAMFPFFRGYWEIAGLRFLDGAFSAGIWVACETQLLMRSDADNKAYVTSLYAISMAVGYIIGPILGYQLGEEQMHLSFVGAGILSLCSAAYVFARLDRDRGGEVIHADTSTSDSAANDPEPTTTPTGAGHSTYGQVAWKIKTSCMATFATGYFQSSTVLMLPLYMMHSKGIARDSTFLIPAVYAAGMLLFTNVAGRLGDRHGHLLWMRVLAFVGLSAVLTFIPFDNFFALCAAVFVTGLTLAAIPPLSLALQGKTALPEEYSRANAVFNAFYAAGLLLGPKLSSVIYDKFGGEVMVIHFAALWAVFVLGSLVFRRDDPRFAQVSG